MTFSFRIAALVLVPLVTATMACAAPDEDGCDPNGVAHEVIACVEKANRAAAKAKFGQDWEAKYKQFADACYAENPGGGSGGRSDRAECVGEKIKNAPQN